MLSSHQINDEDWNHSQIEVVFPTMNVEDWIVVFPTECWGLIQTILCVSMRNISDQRNLVFPTECWGSEWFKDWDCLLNWLLRIENHSLCCLPNNQCRGSNQTKTLLSSQHCCWGLIRHFGLSSQQDCRGCLGFLTLVTWLVTISVQKWKFWLKLLKIFIENIYIMIVPELCLIRVHRINTKTDSYWI